MTKIEQIDTLLEQAWMNRAKDPKFSMAASNLAMAYMMRDDLRGREGTICGVQDD